ncbi:MAG: S-adenosylmethionine:tRNA ribosyltransferase-isomerase, partial [Saprospiraceae bacterium]|nr:S-adenosylmethionine:tRNA ribosyltransferase-isomerase [Saprospiraceae bacterium]
RRLGIPVTIVMPVTTPFNKVEHTRAFGARVVLEGATFDEAKAYAFELPYQLECAKPTEERGLRRDEVRLMVSHYNSDQVFHTQFQQIEEFLQPGDVLIVNTSGTLKAALEGFLQDGKKVRIHFSTKLGPQKWIAEIREVIEGGTRRYQDAQQGETIALKNGGSLQLAAPYYEIQRDKHLKLWETEVSLPIPLEEYLDLYGQPIRYQYIKESYPQSYYQTIFAQEMGSAEMPSAGRPFTHELITRLVTKGVQIAPILLHTGVASLEIDERPYEEYYHVAQSTADLVNWARQQGKRIIAIGTTAIRAIESATNEEGQVVAREGWTDVFITPDRGLAVVDGLLTGFHEPKASHLLMLETLTGAAHLDISYRAALEQQYYWHEFGDVHLILP